MGKNRVAQPIRTDDQPLIGSATDTTRQPLIGMGQTKKCARQTPRPHVARAQTNRFKLRIRFYNNNPDTPVFFEIKRRMNDAIMKQRGGIKRPAVAAVLAGQIPAPDELVSGDVRQLVAIQRFIQLMMRDRAAPTAHVYYEREAWISETDNSVRVTLDRNVQISPEFSARFTSQMDDPIHVFTPLVILELKFTGRFPGWFNTLVKVFNLRLSSASKYADGIVKKGEAFFYRPGNAGLSF